MRINYNDSIALDFVSNITNAISETLIVTFPQDTNKLKSHFHKKFTCFINRKKPK